MKTIKIIETANFRATVNKAVSGYTIKAITPESKALLRVKQMRNPIEAGNLAVDALLQKLDALEDKTEALKKI
jgi:hypothetical protein